MFVSQSRIILFTGNSKHKNIEGQREWRKEKLNADDNIIISTAVTIPTYSSKNVF